MMPKSKSNGLINHLNQILNFFQTRSEILLAWWQQWETPSQHVSSKYYWSTEMTANKCRFFFPPQRRCWILSPLMFRVINTPCICSLSLTERVLAGAEGLVRETISWMARRSLSLCRGLLMPISLWISVSDRLAMMAPLFTLARQAATYHAGIPTHSWEIRRMWKTTPAWPYCSNPALLL